MDPEENPMNEFSEEELVEKLGLEKKPFSIFNRGIEETKAMGHVRIPDNFDTRDKWPGC